MALTTRTSRSWTSRVAMVSGSAPAPGIRSCRWASGFPYTMDDQTLFLAIQNIQESLRDSLT